MHIVQLHQLADAWSEVEGWVKDALAYGPGDESATDVLIRLARGEYACFHEPGRFAWVLQIQQQPRQKVCAVLYLGGKDLEAIMKAVHEHGIPWAQSQGCTSIRVWGRDGWQRALGMKRVGAILQLDISKKVLQ